MLPWADSRCFSKILGIFSEMQSSDIVVTQSSVIIVPLVQWWTLPFLQAYSRPDDPVLSDRQLPDKCWVVWGQIQQSRARCDAGGSSPLAKGPHRSKGLDCGPHIGYWILILLHNRIPIGSWLHDNSGQVFHTLVSQRRSSIICYHRSMISGTLWLGR